MAETGLDDRRHLQVVLIPQGFQLEERRRALWTLRWPQVRRIVAYKTDQGVVDCLCLGLEIDASVLLDVDEDTQGRTAWRVVDEDMEGFRELIPSLESAFPAMSRMARWWTFVVIPAFETNATLIYRRPDVPPSAGNPPWPS